MTPGLPVFLDGKNNVDDYLLWFERNDTVAVWQMDTLTVQLSPLFTGKALDIYFGLSSEEPTDASFTEVRFHNTEQRHREKLTGDKTER